METKNTLDVAKQLIIEAFSFLEEQGYTPVCRIENSRVFIEYLTVEYVNKVRRRAVSISYTKGKVDENIKYTFAASITRLPHSGWEDTFSLWVYLDSINKDFPTSLVNHFDEETAADLLMKIKNALRAHTSEIIDGTVWLETYYPPL